MTAFIIYAKAIQGIIRNLDELFLAGYPKDHRYFNFETFECESGFFNELKEFEVETSKLFEEWS